ncbi:MAG: TldD/PmbA family protein [Acidimicrobiales bacterium]|jgi:PmbA protein|nr:TldD/PmbA family protein [Acidimicrobiales bacterium]
MLDELLAVGDRLVARAHPGEQVEVVVTSERNTEIKAYEGEIESLASAESQGVGVRVVRDGRQGFAYAGTLDEGAVAEVLDEARDNMAFGTVDEYQALAEPDGVPTPELALFRPALLEHPTAAKVDLALELERAIRAADRRIVGVESAEYWDGVFRSAIVSTTGVRNAGEETAAYLSVWALAEQDDETQTGFGFSTGREPGELDPARAAADAARRATRLLGATKPPSERATVVLDPWVTAQLLGILGWTLNGESVLKGRSLFADRLGDDIASQLVTLVDDPTDARAFTATDTDGEGLACRRNVLVADGVLQQFVHNAYTARRAGTVSTGSAVRESFRSLPGVGTQALVLTPGTAGQPELVAAVGDGILVQDVAGLHSGVNPVSGDFSTGAEGLRIRGGALAEPLREFTIGSTLQRLLRDVSAVGADLEWFPMSAAGVSLVIPDVTVSGT